MRPRCERCDNSALLNFIDFIVQTVDPDKLAEALDVKEGDNKGKQP